MSIFQSPFRELLDPHDIASPLGSPGLVMTSVASQDGTRGESNWMPNGPGVSLLSFIPSEYWAAIADGTSLVDMAPYFAAAIATMTSGVLEMPQGTLCIESEIVLSGKLGFTLRGQGQQATKIKTRSLTPINVLYLKGCRYCMFERFTVEGLISRPIATALKSQSLTGYISAANTFRDLYIEGNGGMAYGFRAVVGDFDGNNSEFMFERVEFSGYTEAGASLENSQAQEYTFLRCFFLSNAFGESGIRTTTTGANFRAYDCSLSYNSIADYDVYGGSNGITIVGGLSLESAAYFRVSPGGSANGEFPVQIIGGSFVCDPAELTSDGYVVYYNYPGPFEMIGTYFNAIGSCAQKFFFNTKNFNQQVRVSGVTIYTTEANPFPSGVLSENNRIDRTFGGGTAVPLEKGAQQGWNTLGSDLSWTGPTKIMRAGEAILFGAPCCPASDGLMYRADANAATKFPVTAICLEAADGSGAYVLFGLPGCSIRNDAWAWTIAGTLYLSTTVGEMTQTAPAVAGDCVQVLGYAFPNADTVQFNPSPDWLIHA